MAKKAIVTGGAGFVGSNLAIELESKGFEVVVVDHFKSTDYRNLDGFYGDVIPAEVSIFDWKKLGKCEAIFHQQAITDTTVMDQKLMLEQNSESFRRLLGHCLNTKTPLIYASSAGVYGNEQPPLRENGPLKPLNIYGYSKLLMDRMTLRAIKSAKSPVVGLRYFNVFGPREQYKGKAASMIYQLSEQMRSGQRPRIFEFGEQERDHIYVKDVVSANLCAYKSGKSGVVNVGTGKSTSFNRLIEIIQDVLDIRLAAEYFKNPYSFYQVNTRADASLAKKLIGFESKWSIEAGILDYLSWLYPGKVRNSKLQITNPKQSQKNKVKTQNSYL